MFQLWKKIPQYVISYASSALSGPENQLNKFPISMCVQGKSRHFSLILPNKSILHRKLFYYFSSLFTEL